MTKLEPINRRYMGMVHLLPEFGWHFVVTQVSKAREGKLILVFLPFHFAPIESGLKLWFESVNLPLSRA